MENKWRSFKNSPNIEWYLETEHTSRDTRFESMDSGSATLFCRRFDNKLYISVQCWYWTDNYFCANGQYDKSGTIVKLMDTGKLQLHNLENNSYEEISLPIHEAEDKLNKLMTFNVYPNATKELSWMLYKKPYSSIDNNKKFRLFCKKSNETKDKYVEIDIMQNINTKDTISDISLQHDGTLLVTYCWNNTQTIKLYITDFEESAMKLLEINKKRSFDDVQQDDKKHENLGLQKLQDKLDPDIKKKN